MHAVRTLAPNANLDENWVSLMIVARQMGIPKDEVRKFIREQAEDAIEDADQPN
ncbi:anti-repressor SinI family protein [Paenibacillus ginsengihumi]|jgi:hypothetical protein|uniref:anti-repressor SinI family protein n=1 Tax=Paenibacillus ginsengihumi TaxID=431596 RepID=UPI000374FB51|nr:anti-repressor SinI family protein [Paenibacillus ginsengihumi]